jgi:hypothetical protein
MLSQMRHQYLLHALVAVILLLSSGCFEQFPTDCRPDQYHDREKMRCKKIVHDCQTDSDCSAFESCVEELIHSSLGVACRVGEKCPDYSRFHNVCRLTDETKLYCEQDSDCVLAITPGECCLCQEIYGRSIVEARADLVIVDYDQDLSAYSPDNCSHLVCDCFNFILPPLKCVNGQCQDSFKEVHDTYWEEHLNNTL